MNSRKAILAPIRRLFSAMEKGDSSMLRQVFHPSVRLLTVTLDASGRAVLRSGEEVSAFARSIAAYGPGVLQEPIYRVRVRRYGPYAEVVAHYAFFFKGKFHHCGIDSFQLMKTDDGWCVVGLTDTRQKEGCRVPGRIRRNPGG